MITKKAWLVRPYPHQIRRLLEFKSKNIIAVGWPGIGDLTGKSREDLKHILADKPYSLEGLALGNAYATIDLFVNQMQAGDLVLVPDGDDIYFAEIQGSYYLEASVDNTTPTGGYPHQRPVKWLADVSRKELSKSLRSSLKVHRTTADLSQHAAEIDALAHGKSFTPAADQASDLIQVSYPLRPDCTITFSVPADITRDEARRLSVYLSSLYFAQ